MWNGLNAALWCRVINLDQHRLPACRKNITLKENHPSLTRMGTKGRSSIYNQWNPSLVWASPSLQRTSLGCFPRQSETPCMCRRCWKWSAETCAGPRSVLHASTLKPVALFTSALAVLTYPYSWEGDGFGDGIIGTGAGIVPGSSSTRALRVAARLVPLAISGRPFWTQNIFI